MLSLFLAVPFVGGSAVAAQYQGGGQGGPRDGGRRGPMSPDDRLKQMTKDFKLTSDQQAKIKPILEDAQKKMQDLRNDANGDFRAMRPQMQQIQQDTSAQIRGNLDDKQKDKFDKMEKERQERFQGRRGGRGPGGPPPTDN